MAIYKENSGLIGSINGYCYYRLPNCNHTIVRKNHGKKKKETLNSLKYEGSRKYQKEFNGCVEFGSMACGAIGDFNEISDYSLNPELIRRGSYLLELDTLSENGKRYLLLSANKNELCGFNFNRNITFDNVVNVNLESEMDMESLIFEVGISPINPNYRIQINRQFSVLRFVFVVGRLSDLKYNPELDIYEPVIKDLEYNTSRFDGPWFSKDSYLGQQIMRGQLPEIWKAEMTDHVNLVLSIAIEFGEYYYYDQDIKVLNFGYGKVLNVF